MVAVEAVVTAPCPSCVDDTTQSCDRCDNGRVIAVLVPPKSTTQIIREKLALLRAKCGG